MSDNIKFGSGFNNCEDRMKILENSVVQRKLDNFKEMQTSESQPGSYVYVDNDGEASKVKLNGLLNPNRVKSDFDETDPESDAFIKNKESIKNFVNSRLTEDLTSLYTVGGVTAGEVFEAGTSLLDIIKAILSTSRGTAVRFGKPANVPSTIEDVHALPEFERSVSDLIINGFVVNNLTLNNEYFIMAVPKNAGIIVDSVIQGGFPISFKHKVIDNTWYVYYDDQPVTGTYSFKYVFKEGVHND